MVRGKIAKISVEASTNDSVTLQIYYRHRKPVTWHGKIGGKGKLTRSWTVPKKAPVGVTVVKVTVDGPDGKVQKLVLLHIVR